MLTIRQILDTQEMFNEQKLDIRTVTMGISLLDCIDADGEVMCRKIYEKITRMAERLVPVSFEIEKEFGIPIIHKRVSVTPIAMLAGASTKDVTIQIAKTLDRAGRAIGINFLGGYSALVHKGFTKGDLRLINSIPEALASTEIVCSSVNVATTRAGMNMDAIREMGFVIKETARLTKENDSIGCAKLVVFSNAVEDNPFMAGAFHGPGEAECTINVGVSGPGVIKVAIERVRGKSFDEVSEAIKQSAFKVTRMGELVAREASSRLGVPYGIVDLSLAPTPEVGDSVARILEEMGLETCGTHGSTAALAMLNDAVKKGGAMASSHVGGLSGAFIPVSEDEGMIEAVEKGHLSLDKLEAMTCVCSVGLDMIAIPGDTPAETISAIIADEAAIGMINSKTTAVRLIPVYGKGVGDSVEFGGLLGRAPIMPVNKALSKDFIDRGGRIPAPIHSLRN